MSQTYKKHVAQIGTAAVLLVLVLVLLGPIPMAKQAVAQIGGFGGSEISYGGLNPYQIICTCSANVLNYVFDYKTKTLLMLIYQPGASMLYQYFDIFGTYLLGTYQPGVGQCQIYAGEDCVQLPSTGQMGNQPGTGTSL